MRTPTGLVLFALLAAPALAAEKVAKYPQTFTTGNQDIVVLPIGESDALIEITGINDEAIDGKIFRHSKKCQTTKCEHFIYATTQIPGKDNWWTLELKGSPGWESATFMYPGMSKREPVYLKERDKTFDSQAFHQRYLGQNAATAAAGQEAP